MLESHTMRTRVIVLVALALVGCDRAIVAPVQPGQPSTTQLPAEAPDSGQMQMLARGLAMALQSAPLRAQTEAP